MDITVGIVEMSRILHSHGIVILLLPSEEMPYKINNVQSMFGQTEYSVQ